jgi:hypothetical protein
MERSLSSGLNDGFPDVAHALELGLVGPSPVPTVAGSFGSILAFDHRQ